MIRKQVYLSPAQDQRLRQTARRERRAEAEIIRDLLDRYLLQTSESPVGSESDPLWEIVGMTEGPERDLSTQVDEYLYGRSAAK